VVVIIIIIIIIIAVVREIADTKCSSVNAIFSRTVVIIIIIIIVILNLFSPISFHVTAFR